MSSLTIRTHSYVDRQTDNLIAEIDRKLALKADQTREADIAATTRHINEEVARLLQILMHYKNNVHACCRLCPL